MENIDSYDFNINLCLKSINLRDVLKLEICKIHYIKNKYEL